MKHNKNLKIERMGTSDIESLRIILDAYNTYASGEHYDEIGFNINSGYVYIALDNGIQIASCFGQDADYIIYDFETGEETFFETYKEALSKI